MARPGWAGGRGSRGRRRGPGAGEVRDSVVPRGSSRLALARGSDASGGVGRALPAPPLETGLPGGPSLVRPAGATVRSRRNRRHHSANRATSRSASSVDAASRASTTSQAGPPPRSAPCLTFWCILAATVRPWYILAALGPWESPAAPPASAGIWPPGVGDELGMPAWRRQPPNAVPPLPTRPAGSGRAASTTSRLVMMS
jgi:hypothetical protein